ncbi:MAG TPA: YwbE family protein, partial [Candidatus Kerfeldbacteria bacterium]|nr:YwbE family protein [Candidatus Kerfeldbacteria bacterium]
MRQSSAASISPGSRREDIYPGLAVDIVLKKDQSAGTLTRGIVQDLLTSKSVHPRGIKVRLTSGQVGRVQHIVGQVTAAA